MSPGILGPGVDGNVIDGDADACVEFGGEAVATFVLSESKIKQCKQIH